MLLWKVGRRAPIWSSIPKPDTTVLWAHHSVPNQLPWSSLCERGPGTPFGAPCIPSCASPTFPERLSEPIRGNTWLRQENRCLCTTSCLSFLHRCNFPLCWPFVEFIYAEVKIIFHRKACNNVLMNNSLCFYRNEPVMGCCVLTGRNKVAEIWLHRLSHKMALN